PSFRAWKQAPKQKGSSVYLLRNNGLPKPRRQQPYECYFEEGVKAAHCINRLFLCQRIKSCDGENLLGSSIAVPLRSKNVSRIWLLLCCFSNSEETIRT